MFCRITENGMLEEIPLEKILEDLEKKLTELKLRCFVKDGSIALNYDRYWIDLKRCNTYASILWWVHHLSEKRWFDIELARFFIETAVSENKLTMYKGQK